MPTIRAIVAATTTDALSNVKFADIPPQGAVINLWASAVTVTDAFGLSIGDRDIVTDGTNMNIEGDGWVQQTATDRILATGTVLTVE